MNEFFQRHRSALGDGAAAFSLASLLFVWAYADLLYDHFGGYHSTLPLRNSMLLALAVNVLVFGLLAWSVARLARRHRSRAFSSVVVSALCVLLLVPLNFARIHGGMHLSLLGAGIAPWVPKLLGAAVVLAGVGLALLWPRLLGRVLRRGLLLFFPLGLYLGGKLGYCLMEKKPEIASPRPAVFLKTDRSANPPPRLVWIVFDGFDQRVAFSARPAGLPLPEFDRLRAECIFATNAHAPSGCTLLSMPALTVGRYVVKAERAGPSELRIAFTETNSPVAWTAQPNIFSQVHALGRNVALAGWYHPYDRLFGNVACAAIVPESLFYGTTRGRTFSETMVNQVFSIVTPVFARWQHLQRHQQALEAVLPLAANRDIHLVFWHSVIPHFPGIYDPVSGRLTCFRFAGFGDYFGNLALADRTMGQVRLSMEKAGLWNQSWVLVSSDHPWQEAARCYGSEEWRVPFLLKPPDAGAPITYGRYLGTVVSPGLVLAILRGEVRTGPEAVAWLNSHRVRPVGYERIVQDE